MDVLKLMLINVLGGIIVGASIATYFSAVAGIGFIMLFVFCAAFILMKVHRFEDDIAHT